MNKLRSLNKLLKDIEKISTQILDESSELIKTLTEDDNDIVDSIVEQHPQTTKEDALLLARDVFLKLIEDAEAIKQEIHDFISYNDNTFVINNRCIFLSQVWHGDAYDKPEIEGMDALRNDLLSQYNNITEEYLVERCVRVLKSSK
jgi:hypothetical protein